MADQLPAGAPRVLPAKDSLAQSYERLTRQPRRAQTIHNPFASARQPTSRILVAAVIALGLFGAYVVTTIARAVMP